MRTLTFVCLVVLLLLTFVFSLVFGGMALPFGKILHAIFNPFSSTPETTIIWNIRLPRILLGIFIGAGLSACGCVFQGMLRNPLADPFTLGISGGSAFGITVGIVLGAGRFFYIIPLFAFLGALLSVSLVYLIAGRRYFSVPILILSGIVLSFMFSSIVYLLFAIMKPEELHRTMLWLMGNLSTAHIHLIKIVALINIIGVIILVVLARELNILTLGDEKALSLGVDAKTTRKILFVISSFLTGACVSAAGIIGFVGLIVPHIMRRITGPDHTFLLPASALGGAIFLTLSDTLAKTVLYPMELPVGVITGLLGSGFLLVFLLKAKRW